MCELQKMLLNILRVVLFQQIHIAFHMHTNELWDDIMQFYYLCKTGDAVDEAVREEMAKLDQMELRRNGIVLVEEDEAAALFDKDDEGAIDDDNGDAIEKGNDGDVIDKDAAGAIDAGAIDRNNVDKGNEVEPAEVIDDVKDVVAKGELVWYYLYRK